MESIIFCTSFLETNAAVSFSEQRALAVKATPGTSIAKYLRERAWKPPQAIQSSRKQISILVDCQRPVDRDGRQRSTRPPGGSLLTRKNTAFTSVLLLQEIYFFEFPHSRQQSTRPPGVSLLTGKDTAFPNVLPLQEINILSCRQEVVF